MMEHNYMRNMEVADLKGVFNVRSDDVLIASRVSVAVEVAAT